MIDPVSVFSRLAFYPTVLYSVLMTRLSARRWYNRIDDTVILGALPFKKLAKQLVQEEGVRGVVSLNEAHELKYLTLTEQEWSELGVSQLKLGIVDYVGTPNVSQLVEGVAFIEKYRSTDGSVYVHCKAGRTRSATLVACYLIKLHGWSPEQAVEFLTSKRPHIWIREKQLMSLRNFYSSIR